MVSTMLQIPNSHSQNQFPPMDMEFEGSDDGNADADGDGDAEMKSSWRTVTDVALPLSGYFEDDDMDALQAWIVSFRKRGARCV